MKVMVIGSGGSGKSTFSRELAELTNLPHYPLDRYYWRLGWDPMPNEEWDRFLVDLVKKEDWILDGNFSRTMDLRMRAADVVIYFDLPTLLCVYRIIKRRLQYRGKTRPDMGEGCPEMLDWAFVKWVWQFRRKRRQGILQKLAKYKGEKTILIFRKTREASEFLGKVEKEGLG